jgi:hypothetical protein
MLRPAISQITTKNESYYSVVIAVANEQGKLLMTYMKMVRFLNRSL